MRQDLFVGDVRQGDLVKLVVVHELVEDVRAKHHRLGNHDIRVVKGVQVGKLLDDVVQEGQAAPLPAQGAFPDAGEVAETVETVALEHSHHALVLHPPVAHDGVVDDLAVCVHVLQRTPGDVLQEFRDGEQGPRTEPARHVVPRDMVKQGLLRQGKDIVLKVFQVLDARHLLQRVRVPEHEIAETEMTAHQPAQVHSYLLGVLVDEMRPAFLGPPALVRLGGLHDQRHELVFGTDGRQQFVTGHLVGFPATGETAVADDPQRVLLVTAVQPPCLFIRPRQHDFRTPAHPQGLQLRVQGFRRELQALLQHETVEVGQDGGIETDGILHQQNHLHARRHVVLQVHLVLNQLDDGKQQVRVAQPAEHIVENGEVHVFHALAYAVAERCQDDNRYHRILHLDAPRDVEHIIVVRARHTYNQVEGGLAQLLFRLFLGSHLEETRRIAQPQLHILVENLLFHPPVVLQHERIIRIGNQQHVENPPLHQVHEVGVPQQGAFFVIIVCHIPGYLCSIV